MAQTKSWKSFDDQLALLKDRGLGVENDAAALDYLERVGYYRLSGYFYPFRELEITLEGGLNYQRNNHFIEGSRFEEVVQLYVFDKRLRLLALDALERIELAIRVDIAYLLGKRDIYAHENPACLHGNFSKKVQKYSGKTLHDEWLEKYHGLVNRARKEPFVAHYVNKYQKLPIWVAIEIWDFGALSKLFSGLNIADQDKIAGKYGVSSGKEFAGWLRGLNFVRNVSAHHSRLWNINILERAKVWKKDDDWQAQNNARPFYYFCLMQQMLSVICPSSTWSNRFKELLATFPENGAVKLSDLGTTENWQEWDLWQ